MKGLSHAQFDTLGTWECCDRYYTAAVRECRVCGSPKSDNPDERHNQPQPEHRKLQTLELPPQAKKAMVNITGNLLIRITRQINSGGLDSDNLSGGLKELRDAIAEALGRQGDSEKDGLRFEYCQLKGQKATIIEIFKEKNV